MSFGGDYGKDTGDYVNAAKDAIATMVAALPKITIMDRVQAHTLCHYAFQCVLVVYF